MQFLTNAFIIDANHSTTQSVVYPSPLTYGRVGDAPWFRAIGGGLSTVSTPLSNDHVQITGSRAAHGGSVAGGDGYNFASTISGVIITDKPVVTMSPRPLFGGPGDNLTLNPYAIGVPPLAYQWRLNGVAVPGATNASLSIPTLTLSQAGNYDLVVTNSYGSATSQVASVTEDVIALAAGQNFVTDSNPANTPRVGIDSGATWLASSSDGTTTRTGVMSFVATNSNKITVGGSSNFNATNGTVSFWMRSAGTDTNSPGSNQSGLVGAALFGRPGSAAARGFVLLQEDGGQLEFIAPNNGTSANQFASAGSISDNKWHLITLTYDNSAAGSVSLYIDGVLDTTSFNFTAWTWPVGAALQIGYSSDASWRSYNGLLSDVRFYSRTLLPSEIASVYSSGALVDTGNLQMDLSFTTPPGAGFALSWQLGSAVLQSAPAATGPYTDVVGGSSPFNTTAATIQKYFRYRYVPVTQISNPHLM
jgi:hypothetical protein